jgi:hypothetical protein
VDIPGLGRVGRDGYGDRVSEPVFVPALGRACTFELSTYDADPQPGDFHAAIRNLLAADRSLLLDASEHVFQYCRDTLADTGPDHLGYDEAAAHGLRALGIERPADVWKHVRLGDSLRVCRDRGRGRDVYLSCECNCDWEGEHGLQLVFRDGLAVSKVGPYDGHVTNVSAYADPSLAGVVYHRP